MKEALYWKFTDGAVRCTLCPHACSLSGGEWGLCGARQAQGKMLIARSFGHILALNADPIEKKPLKRFLPGTYTLSLGAPGCNLFCYFCQNHTLSRARPSGAAPVTTPGEVAALAEKQGFPSISYTYNEPLTSIEFVLETAAHARKKGLKNILVTNAYCNPEPFDDALGLIDALNIDVKSYRPDAFRRDTGGVLDVVLRNVERAAQKAHVEITTLMVPGLCGVDDVEAVARWLGALRPGIPLHITRYHPVSPGQPAATPLDAMDEAERRAKAYLETVFLGNV